MCLIGFSMATVNQHTINWMPDITQLWLNLNWVSIWFDLGKGLCRFRHNVFSYGIVWSWSIWMTVGCPKLEEYYCGGLWGVTCTNKCVREMKELVQLRHGRRQDCIRCSNVWCYDVVCSRQRLFVQSGWVKVVF